MKRVGDIYEKIVSYENCREAVLEESFTHRLSRKRGRLRNKKGEKSSHGERIREELEMWTKRVQERLLALPYIPHGTIEFDRMEGGKLRHISMHTVFDSMCIRAFVRVVEPIIYARMTPHSYCPIKGRGPLKLARRIKAALREHMYTNKQWMELHPKQKRYVWVLKTDVKKFFPSIGYAIAMESMGRWIKDKRVLSILGSLLKISGGVPIGSAYSAMIANSVHLEIDWMMASYLKVLNYWRYMDDVVMLFASKSAAINAKKEYERLLAEKELTFERKWQIFRADRRPITLGGFKIRADSIHISGRIARHLTKILNKAERVKWQRMSESEWRTSASLYGWIKTTDSFNYLKKWRQTNGKCVFRLIGLSERPHEHRSVSLRNLEEESSDNSRCDLYRNAA